ncbi:MAG: 2TM domain-containing protein [Anaerolineales bacterium]|nr:2TM domain-containing protein [Anaerolineales bacterium]MCB9128369.1 2TM domain-containing protein [Ardenticatenales bacterium]MCB9172181.1 2TM domain-containing protein [Ardenticatenales bacterium]
MDESSLPQESFYSEQQARDILKIASRLEYDQSDFSEAHLQQMAQELGISENALVRAKAQYLVEKEQLEAQREEVELQSEFEKYRRNAFMTHLVVTVIIIPMLIAINLLTSTEFLWFFIPMFAMLVGLGGHYWGLQQKEGSFYNQQYHQWLMFNRRKHKRLSAGN